MCDLVPHPSLRRNIRCLGDGLPHASSSLTYPIIFSLTNPPDSHRNPREKQIIISPIPGSQPS